jgi:hypothetical protein
VVGWWLNRRRSNHVDEGEGLVYTRIVSIKNLHLCGDGRNSPSPLMVIVLVVPVGSCGVCFDGRHDMRTRTRYLCGYGYSLATELPCNAVSIYIGN